MHRPLFGIAVVFVLGICLAAFGHIPFALFYWAAVSTVTLSLIFLRKEPYSATLLYISYFLLGAVFYLNAVTLSANHISKFNFIKNQNVFLKGVVVSSTEKRELSKIKKTNFILEVKEIKLINNWYKTSGKVLVNSFSGLPFSFGDLVVLEGKLVSPQNFYLGRGKSYADYLKNKGIFYLFSLRKNNLAETIASHQGNSLISVSLKAKKVIQKIIYKNLPSLEAGMLEAFILGERRNLPQEINSLFIQTGTVHILAISGFNVGIVIFIILILLKILRLNRKLRLGLTMFFIVIYAIITGCQPSVIRASIMAMVLLLGILLEREVEVYSSLALAALIILMFNPQALFDVGFQLSFISVISIVWMTPKIEKSLKGLLNSKPKILSAVVRLFCVSFAAWIGVLGLVAFYFNILSPVTLIANLFIVPFSSILVALGFCLVGAGAVLPSLAFVFGASVKLALDFLVYAVYLFSKLPAAFFYLKALSVYQVLAYYLIIFLLFSLIKRPAEGHIE